jgi:uridine phosphorylase
MFDFCKIKYYSNKFLQKFRLKSQKSNKKTEKLVLQWSQVRIMSYEQEILRTLYTFINKPDAISI